MSIRERFSLHCASGKGFMLLELLISLAIMFLVLVMFGKFRSTLHARYTHIKDTSHAFFIARSIIEQVQANKTIATKSIQKPEKYRIEVNYIHTNTVETQENIPRLKLFNVIVSWNLDLDNRDSVSLTGGFLIHE